MFKPARRLSLAIGLIGALTASSLTPAVALAQGSTQAQEPRYSAIVVDANTGEVLYAKRPDSPRYPASITKVMTLYLTYEALAEGRLKLTDSVLISPHAAAQAPSKLGLRPGESISVDDAIRALAVKSANDMAVALAEKIGGTEQRFAALMTLRAQELGMKNTRYVNASGLPDSRQISSARDIAMLSRAVMRDYPQYYHYFSTQQFAFHGQVMKNHNGLLGKMAGVDGLKTGFTNASGFNLAASAVRDNRRLIAVVMGGSSTAARDNNVEDLLLTGFDVLNRRAKGENITVAQNLFEPEPAEGPIQRAPIEEGDAEEQDGLQIRLTNNPAAPIATASKVSSSVSAAKKAAAKGDWAVQVGSFKKKTLATSHLKTASAKFPVLASADGSVAGKPGAYRVKFAGFSADAARQACATLKAQRQSCMVVEPS